MEVGGIRSLPLWEKISALELEYAPGIVFSESLETCESPPWRYNLQIIFINSKLPASPAHITKQ